MRSIYQFRVVLHHSRNFWFVSGHYVTIPQGNKRQTVDNWEVCDKLKYKKKIFLLPNAEAYKSLHENAFPKMGQIVSVPKSPNVSLTLEVSDETQNSSVCRRGGGANSTWLVTWLLLLIGAIYTISNLYWRNILFRQCILCNYAISDLHPHKIAPWSWNSRSIVIIFFFLQFLVVWWK